MEIEGAERNVGDHDKWALGTFNRDSRRPGWETLLGDDEILCLCGPAA